MADFSLNDTQQQMIALAAEFGKNVIEPAEIAIDKMADPDAAFASDTFKKTMASAFELGFHKMGLSEEHGGLGLDPMTTGVVWEELARYGVGFSASLMASSVVPALIAFLAPTNKALVDGYVKPFCDDTTGTKLTAWGSSEPLVGSDGKNYEDPSIYHRTTATKVDGGYKLNGAKSAWVSNGGIANAFVIFACLDKSKGLKGSGMFVVPRSAKGLSTGPTEDRVGMRALNQATINLDDVFIADDHLLFPPSDAYAMLHHSIMTVGNLGTGYLAVGLMRAAFEEALVYAKERVQWGKPIFEHQLVAKKLFDCHAAIESSRALLWKGSWHSAQGFPGDLKTSLTAKILSTHSALHHTAEMVQVLGGYGITKDYKLEKYMRDASLLTIMDGTNDTLMMEVASRL